jgi:RNA polymerase sigma-70 factor (ECF subfamily)
MKLSPSKINNIFATHHHLIINAVKSLRPEVSGITADDVEQEVCIRVLKLIKSDREIENISSYIYRITANVIIDLARKNQKHIMDLGLPDEQDEEDFRPDLISDDVLPSQQLENEDLIKQVLNVIETLPEDRRIAVKLRLQGFSVKEMSEMTGWPFYKAENLSKRAMQALKEKLDKLGIEYECN